MRCIRNGRLSTLTVLVLLSAAAHINAWQLGARSADEWANVLENPERVSGLKIAEVVSRLSLQPGQVVADIGAGTGLFESALSKAVSSSGTVYAVDIDQRLLDRISKLASAQGLTNVRVVLGKYSDPALPARNIDLAVIIDVLHHIQNREAYLKALSGYLSPSGRIAIIDFHPGRGGHASDPAMQVAKTRADAWLAGAGLVPVQEISMFEDKWFAIYGRRKSPVQ